MESWLSSTSCLLPRLRHAVEAAATAAAAKDQRGGRLWRILSSASALCAFSHLELLLMLLLCNCVSSPLLWTNSESPPVANTQNMLRNMIWHTRIISLSPWASDQTSANPTEAGGLGDLWAKGLFPVISAHRYGKEEPNMGMAEERQDSIWSTGAPAAVHSGAGRDGRFKRMLCWGLSSTSFFFSPLAVRLPQWYIQTGWKCNLHAVHMQEICLLLLGTSDQTK